MTKNTISKRDNNWFMPRDLWERWVNCLPSESWTPESSSRSLFILVSFDDIPRFISALPDAFLADRFFSIS